METSETTLAYSVATTIQEEPKLETKPHVANNDVQVVLIADLVVGAGPKCHSFSKARNPKCFLDLQEPDLNSRKILLNPEEAPLNPKPPNPQTLNPKP